jgi:STE24 endopeptidase
VSADRPTAALVTALAAVLLVAVAAWLVPWHPVPGPALVVPPADQVFSAAAVARAEQFAWWARVWSWSSLALSLAVLCLLGFGPTGRRLVGLVPGPWWVQVVGAVAIVLGVSRLLTLPLAVAARQHARDYGLSEQSWVGFGRDQAVSWAVSVVALGLAATVVVGAARRWPRAWPGVAGVALGTLVLLGSFVYPLLVEPLFNRFTPLPDGPLRSAVLALAEKEGVQVGDVLVADASRRTTTLNAYVSGFSGTRRVVLYDNLVESVPEDEVLAVVAHELAHARHQDVVTGSVLAALGAALAIGVLGLVYAGDGRPRAPSSVPALVALVAVGSLLVSPVENAVSRDLEARADVDALRATGDPAAFVAVQRQLALRSLADPTPPAWSQWWFGSHPTVLERVAIAERVTSG